MDLKYTIVLKFEKLLFLIVLINIFIVGRNILLFLKKTNEVFNEIKNIQYLYFKYSLMEYCTSFLLLSLKYLFEFYKFMKSKIWF